MHRAMCSRVSRLLSRVQRTIKPTAIKRGSCVEFGSGALVEPSSPRFDIQVRFERGLANAVQARLGSNRAARLLQTHFFV